MPTNENKFKIGLTNVDFDNTYSNVLHFDSRQQQEEYFSTNTLFVNKPLVNLPIGNYYLQRVVINLAENTDYTDLMNFNYCIIEDTTQNAKIHYWYYFVNKPQYTADKQIICDLELDIFNTYYLDISFQDCLIRKAHINRWVNDTQTGYVRFDCSDSSNLFVQEDIKPQAKRATNLRRKFSLVNDTNFSQEFIDYCDDNDSGWVYAILDKQVFKNNFYPEFIDKTFINQMAMGDATENPYFKNQYCVVCAPLTFATFGSNVRQVDNGAIIDTESLFNFLTNQNVASFIIDVYISPIPPFERIEPNLNITLTTGTSPHIHFQENILPQQNSSSIYANELLVVDSSHGIIFVNIRDSGTMMSYNSRTFNLSNATGELFKFSKNEIINSAHLRKFNPKLLTQQYQELRVGEGASEPYVYDILKLGKSNIKLTWSAQIGVGIFRHFFGIYNDDMFSPVYNRSAIRQMVGCCVANDNTIPYSINQLSQFLAQNKNFFMQRDVTNIGNFVKDLIGTFSHVNKNTGGLQVVGEVTNSAITIAQNYINSDLTLDNMDNAPQSFKNLNGDAFVNIEINNNKPYIALWSCLPSELKIADSYMNMFGYNYNQIDNIKNVDNIRHYFNFIQAEVENIFSENINLSNMIREKFIDVFRKGVRFWNITDLVTQKTYSFTQHENYENWLEE